jgi:hypothetical protein
MNDLTSLEPVFYEIHGLALLAQAASRSSGFARAIAQQAAQDRYWAIVARYGRDGTDELIEEYITALDTFVNGLSE